MAYFKLALEKDPSNNNATDSLCRLILKDERVLLVQIHLLRNSDTLIDKNLTKELKEKLKNSYLEAILYTEKALVYSPQNEFFKSMVTVWKKSVANL